MSKQIRVAVGASVLGHLLLAGGATALVAFHRASAPHNDDFDRRAPLREGWDARAYGDNHYGSREIGEPAHAATVAGASVWWRWIAPQQPCSVAVEVSTESFDAVVGVYRGAVLGTLSEVVSGRGSREQVLRFVAEPETEYHIAVAGARSGAAGSIELRVLADPETELEEADPLVLNLPDLFTFEEVKAEPEEDQPFMKSDGGEDEPGAPANARFESDRNRQAGSVLPADPEGEENVATRDGEDLPPVSMLEAAPVWKTADRAAPAEDGFIKVPEIDLAPPQELPESPAEPSAFEADLFSEDGVAAAEPEVVPPPMEEVVEPVPEPAVEEAPAATVIARTIGRVETAGESVAATVGTALGRYKAQIDEAVQVSSQKTREAHPRFDRPGLLRVRIWINREGRVVNTQLLHKDATAEMIDLTIQGLKSADIPPIPDEVYEASPDGLVDMVYDIFY